jgi:hypothetical protein
MLGRFAIAAAFGTNPRPIGAPFQRRRNMVAHHAPQKFRGVRAERFRERTETRE